jgi:hypothetical protein
MMVSKPRGRPRGRPKKPLAQDPDRWPLVLLERDVRAGMARGYSNLAMHDMLATFRHGAVVETQENLKLLRRG